VVSGLSKRHKRFEDKREGNVIHATNLINFCPREYALCIKNGVFYNQPKPTAIGQKVTYEIGRRIEDMVREALWEEKVVLDHLKGVGIKKPYPVVGTPDIWVKLSARDRPYIVEVKSIKPDEFDTLIAPKMDHICQVSLYLWFAGLNDLPVHTDIGLIIYVVKLQKTIPIKVYPVHIATEFLKTVQKQLAELKRFSKTKKLPVRTCNSPSALMAKRPCKVLKECFDEEE